VADPSSHLCRYRYSRSFGAVPPAHPPARDNIYRT